MKRLIGLTLALCAALAFADLPENDTYWVINPGEIEVVPAGSALTSLTGLTVNGSLEIASSPLAVNMPANTMIQIGVGEGTNGTLTVASGGKFVTTGTSGSPTSATPSLSVGVLGGTGTLTVESGGELTVQNAELVLGRNGDERSSGINRDLRGHATLNVNGTVWLRRIEANAWMPQLSTALYGTYVVDELPSMATINLNAGGVFTVRELCRDDASVTIVNLNGGTWLVDETNINFLKSGGALKMQIAEDADWILDTQQYHVRVSPAEVQDDFLTISGAGGLVKKGTGYAQFILSSAANTFTGPIVVEAGYLSLGRPLAEGQTVTVKQGAVFYPYCGADLAKITWEDPSEALTATEGKLYQVQAPFADGLDLASFAPYYRTDALGTADWGWGSSVVGAITHGEVSFAHPFEIVGKTTTMSFTNTGLDQLPLRFTGTAFNYTFNGQRTNTTDTAIFFDTTSTYTQGGSIFEMGSDGAKPKLTVSGKGTLAVNGDLHAGYNGHDGEILLESNATVTATSLAIGSTSGGREVTSGKVTIDNAVLTANYIFFGQTSTTTGTDYETIRNELVLNEGAVVKLNERIHRNDDPRARLTFNGGVIYPQKSYADFFYSGQNGIFEIVAGTGDIALNLASYTIGLYDNHIHVSGDRGLSVTGTKGGTGTLVLGITGVSDFSVDYKGDTTLTDATLRIGMETLDLSDTTHGVVTGTRGVLDLYGHTAQVRNVTGTDMTVKGPGTLELGRDNADLTFTPPLDRAALVKSGTGTLTLPNGFSGDALDVNEGTVVLAGTVAYTSYRFKVEGVRSSTTEMQLSELVLKDGATDVTRPYASLNWETVTSCGKTFPANEAPANLVDGNVGTKWLDWRAGTSRSAEDRERAWLRINYAKPTRVTSYAWYTANDGDYRDPTAWRLQGSNDDGATWVDLDVRSGFVPTTTRKTLAGTFACDCAAAVGGPVMVATGATLRVTNTLTVPRLTNHGTVELADGATLRSTGGTLDTTSLGGAGTLEAASGVTTLVGTGAYTGDTLVTGGTLNLGPSTARTTRTFDGKYFRLTIKRSNGGGSGTNNPLPTDYYMQFSEFQLYAADGTHQNKGLTAATIGTAATALSAGTFSADADYPVNTGANEDLAKAFDGNTSTKFCCCSWSFNGVPANRFVVTMRLADSAQPIASYNFYTANDWVRRAPSDWTLEGSRDGITWEVLDTRYWAPHTTFTDKSKYADTSIRYKPFNNGTAFTFPAEQPVAYAGRYFRFTFQKTVQNDLFQLSELGLVDVEGNNVAKGLSMVSAAGTDATTLAANSFVRNTTAAGSGETADTLFDDNPNTKCCTAGYNVNGSQSYIITMRLADTTLPVVGYYLTTANDSLDYRSPSDWKVEGSVDGVTWTTLDTHTGESAPFCLFTSMNGGQLYDFASYSPATALPANSTLQVDAGTVNVNTTTAAIANLRIDCAEAGGTINGFRAAEGGVLELVNLPADVSLYSYELPLAFTNVADISKLRTWQVKIDGKVRAGIAVKIVDGKLKLVSACTIIFVR